MKRFARMAGWILLFGLVCFIAGWTTQWEGRRSANAATAACNDQLKAAHATTDREEGLLLLYRSQSELARKNFGNVADNLSQAKQKLGTALGAAAASIDTAAKAAAGGDANTASDAIESALKALDVGAAPAGSAAPSATP